MLLNTALDGVMPVYRELFARYDLTETQWRVLRVLWEADALSSIELSRQTLIPAPSLVGVLDRLSRKGLITRERSRADRRLVKVCSTAKGQALGETVIPQVERIHSHIRQSVSEADWSAMQRTLDTLTQSTQHLTLANVLNEPGDITIKEAV